MLLRRQLRVRPVGDQGVLNPWNSTASLATAEILTPKLVIFGKVALWSAMIAVASACGLSCVVGASLATVTA